ncbi:MAG: universal stress protein [Candidatus Thiodiazotropha sp.]
MATYQRILCAVDFSNTSEEACKRAVELAGLYDAEISLLHVVEYFPEDRSNEFIAPECDDPAGFMESQAHLGIDELASKTGCQDATRHVLFSPHSARSEIIKFAKENSIDLIILGSHGRHGIAVLLGSTANGVVVRASCDVLAVRAKE